MLGELWNSGIGSWVVYLATGPVFLLIVEIGYRVGKWHRKAESAEQKAQLATVLGSMLALLGFLLAISYSNASERYVERKALVLKEANAIATAFLRADFLPEPHRTRIRRELRDYTRLRIDYVDGADFRDLKLAKLRTEQHHLQMWATTLAAAAEGWSPESPNRAITLGLFIEALNEVIDLNQSRVTVGLHYRTPASLLWILYVVALLSMAVLGTYFGLSGTRNMPGAVALVVAFTVVFLLIVDIGSTSAHLVRVSQQPLVDSLHTMERVLDKAAPVD